MRKDFTHRGTYKNRLSYKLVRWIAVLFMVNAIIFCVALLPALTYLKDTFVTLQLEKINQQMIFGSNQLEQAVYCIVNSSQTLSRDARFRILKYNEVNYEEVPLNIKNQLKSSFYGFMASQNLTSYAALEFEEDTAILTDDIFWRSSVKYYPDFFSVGDLTFEEWRNMLRDNKYGFLPVQHITHNKLYKEEYDALIYSVRWSKSAYMYACFNMDVLKDMFIPDKEKEGYYLTITCAGDGRVLYSNLPETEQSMQSLRTHITSGNIDVDVHISENVFAEKMQPMYFWITFYCIACILVQLIAIVGGTYFSTHPLMGLLEVLDKYKNPIGKFAPRKDFDHISNSIVTVEQNLESYKKTVSVQHKILQAKYMEKALNAQLISAGDITQFHSCFPDFPEQGFYLMYVRLWIHPEKQKTVYNEPLMLIGMFLEQELPDAYHQQQLSDTELLLVISEQAFETCRKKMDFLIENINREEEGYEIHCFASNLQNHLEKVPEAYLQVRNMEGFFFDKGDKQVCVMEEGFANPEAKISISTFMTFYTAISYGNLEMALEWLKSYSEELAAAQNTLINRYAFEMLRSILNCIKMEQVDLLADQTVPAYGSYKKLEMGESLYTLLEETVQTFCECIDKEKDSMTDSFGQELLRYVDSHYTDSELCVTALAEHFGRSASTIRNAFKENTNITIAAYIEQKRMNLANELLAQKQKPIAEIAAECGFSNANSFYKAYRRVYGHAPSAKAEQKE